MRIRAAGHEDGQDENDDRCDPIRAEPPSPDLEPRKFRQATKGRGSSDRPSCDSPPNLAHASAIADLQSCAEALPRAPRAIHCRRPLPAGVSPSGEAKGTSSPQTASLGRGDIPYGPRGVPMPITAVTLRPNCRLGEPRVNKRISAWEVSTPQLSRSLHRS